jgi:hypothetical protein
MTLTSTPERIEVTVLGLPVICGPGYCSVNQSVFTPIHAKTAEIMYLTLFSQKLSRLGAQEPGHEVRDAVHIRTTAGQIHRQRGNDASLP